MAAGTDRGKTSKAAWVLLGLGVVGLIVAFWWSLNTQEEYLEHQAMVQTDAWGRDILGLCAARLTEQPAPVPPGLKVAFVGRESSTGGPVTVHNVQLPTALRASGKNNVTHVACIAYDLRALPKCTYERGYTVARRQHHAAVRLVDVGKRAVVATWTAQGSEPVCPSSIQVRRGQQSGPQQVDGSEPDFVRGLFEVPGVKKKAAS